MFHLVHPDFGALVAFARGVVRWANLDGGQPMGFDSKRDALSTLAELPIGGERQLCNAQPRS
jgi:hypothetical protein